jgi:hypothetical protein
MAMMVGGLHIVNPRPVNDEEMKRTGEKTSGEETTWKKKKSRAQESPA